MSKMNSQDSSRDVGRVATTTTRPGGRGKESTHYYEKEGVTGEDIAWSAHERVPYHDVGGDAAAAAAAAAGGTALAIPDKGKKMRDARSKRRSRAPCCCIVWDWNEDEDKEKEGEADKLWRHQQARAETRRDTRRDMQTPEQLRDFITSWKLRHDETKTTPSTATGKGQGGGGGGGSRGGNGFGIASMYEVGGRDITGSSGQQDKKEEHQEEEATRPLCRKKTRKPLIILHGLPSTFVRILLDSEALAIDPDFIEAHAWRRRYHRPSERCQRRPRKQRGDQEEEEAPKDLLQYTCWNYPELVRGFKKTLPSQAAIIATGASKKKEEHRGGGDASLPDRRRRGCVVGTVADPTAPVDLLGNEKHGDIRPVSDCEDLAAVFCRASLWKKGPVGVLFLDRPVWEGPCPSPLKKARRKGRGAVTEPFMKKQKGGKEGNLWDVCLAPAKERLGFEEAVHETLAAWLTSEEEEENDGHDDTLLIDALQETAYQKWLDFFEVLTPRQHPLILDGTSLEWRVWQALEENLVMAREQQRRVWRSMHDGTATVSVSDWEQLIQRLRRHVEFLPTIPTALALANNQGPPLWADQGRLPFIPAHRHHNKPLPGESNDSPPAESDNQRALDRVTYLGGALLPLSIVSGMLSMNDDFEPQGRFFWVFWAAAVPLTVLTLVIIYADKLRRVQVLVPVTADDPPQGPTTTEGMPTKDDASSLAGSPWADGKAIEVSGKGRKNKKKTTRLARNYGGVAGGGHLASLASLERSDSPPLENRNDTTHHVTAGFPESIPYGGRLEGDDIVIDLSGAIPQGQGQHQSQNTSATPPPPPPPGASIPGDLEPSEEDDSDSDDQDNDPDQDDYMAEQPPPPPMTTWRRKELGWAGAAMCILKMQKPKLRVEDGLPTA